MSYLKLFGLVIGILILCYLILYFMDRKKLYLYWNDIIANQCNYQNEFDRTIGQVPSLQNVWICQNEEARRSHITIFLNHDDILERIEEYFRVMTTCADERAPQYRKGGTRYFPFITNGEINPLANSFGFDNFKTSAFNLGLLTIDPEATTSWREAFSRGVYRYHYAIKLPKQGDFGLDLRERKPVDDKDEVTIHRVKWKEKQGFIWDPTFNHRLFNQSNEPCFILVADFPRQLSARHQLVNSFLHSYFPPNL